MVTMKYISFLPLFLISQMANAEQDISKLLKVDSNNKSKCVEYYLFKNELFCSEKAISEQGNKIDLEKYEKLKIVFDDRIWKPITSQSKDNISTVEYIPEDSDANSFNELLTSQYIPNLPSHISPKDFADLEIKFLKKDSPKLTYKFIEEKPNEVIFEFVILEPQSEQQHEIQYIRKKGKDLYVLHYVKSGKNMGETTKEKWINRMKQSTILAK
jgi:hypothetical protein